MSMQQLTSDHVNYLVWRYLQERGYGFAAIQLQRDWSNNDPQSLPFALDVPPSALTNILKDGLHYDYVGAVEYSLLRKYGFIDEHQPSSAQQAPHAGAEMGVSDPSSSRSLKRPGHDGIDSNDRKRRATSRQQAIQQDAMEVDPPVQLKIEEPPPVSTADIGQEIGVQTVTIYEPAAARTVAVIKIGDADVFNLSWVNSPVQGEEQRLLATGGHIWRSFRMPTSIDAISDISNELTWTEFGRSVVSSSAIDSSGKKLALAVERGHETTQLIIMSPSHDQRGERCVLAKVSGAVLLLRWSTSAEMLFYSAQVAAPVPEQPDKSKFSVLNVTTRSVVDITDHVPVEDAAWVDDTKVVTCGNSLLKMFTLNADGNQVDETSSIETNRVWSMIRYDSVTDQACCISPDDCSIALLNLGQSEFSVRTETTLQDGNITAVEWQPLPPPTITDIIPTADIASTPTPTIETAQVPELSMQIDSEPAPSIPKEEPASSSSPSTPRILATSTTSGTIILWNAAADLTPLRTLKMPELTPAMTLAFSPDGKYIAACGGDTISIWTVEDMPETPNVIESKDMPYAVWKDTAVPVEPGIQPTENTEAGDNAQAEEEAWSHQVLCWNSTGERIAYSTGNKIAVIDLPQSSTVNVVSAEDVTPVSTEPAPTVLDEARIVEDVP